VREEGFKLIGRFSFEKKKKAKVIRVRLRKQRSRHVPTAAYRRRSSRNVSCRDCDIGSRQMDQSTEIDCFPTAAVSRRRMTERELSRASDDRRLSTTRSQENPRRGRIRIVRPPRSIHRVNFEFPRSRRRSWKFSENLESHERL